MTKTSAPPPPAAPLDNVSPATSLPRIAYTIDEAQQILACSEHMLIKGAESGRFPHLAYPRGIRFTEEHLHAIAQMHEVEPTVDSKLEAQSKKKSDRDEIREYFKRR